MEQNKKIILIVEDDDSIRGGIVRALKDDDLYQPVSVENGLVALDWLSKNDPPSLIVADFMMLGNGADLALTARNLQISYIMITAAPELAVEALEKLNIKIPIFPKPFEIFEVLEAIDLLTRTNPKINAA